MTHARRRGFWSHSQPKYLEIIPILSAAGDNFERISPERVENHNFRGIQSGKLTNYFSVDFDETNSLFFQAIIMKLTNQQSNHQGK